MKPLLSIICLFIIFSISNTHKNKTTSHLLKNNKKKCKKPNPIKYANFNFTEAKPYSYLISNLTWCDESICGGKKNAICISNTTCKCFFHYKQVKDYNSKGGKVELCNYYQYSQTQIMFYEILFPGLGFIIIGKYFWGLFKMFSLPYVYSQWVKKEKNIYHWFLMIIVGYLLLFLHFRDFYLLYTHQIRDRHNVSLFTKSKISNYIIHKEIAKLRGLQ